MTKKLQMERATIYDRSDQVGLTECITKTMRTTAVEIYVKYEGYVRCNGTKADLKSWVQKSVSGQNKKPYPNFQRE